MTTNEFTTQSNNFHVASYGNGWAYEITDRRTGASHWFQDQDAEFLQKSTNNFEDEDAISCIFECLE